MSDPLVTIVMRSFNEAWALRDTLPALRTQNYRAWELIVIDSGSTDATLEIARGHGAKIVNHPFENYGAQRNWAP